MKAIKNFYCKFPIIISLIVVFGIMEVMHYFRHALPFSSLNNNLIVEIFGAVVVLILIAWITGADEIKFSTVGFKYTFKVTWFILLWGLLLAIFGIFSKIYQHEQIYSPVLTILECAVFAMFVGLFEEGLYRGIFLSSLLSKFGGTRKGLVSSLILAALLFGFIHVYSDFFGFFTDPSTYSLGALGQVVGKTLSTGIFGFVLSVAYVRTHNLWGIAIIHAINDLGGFLNDYLFDPNNTQVGSYVNTGTPGGLSFVSYLAEAVIMIPLLIYCFKQIQKTQLPQWGMFKERWYPLEIFKNNDAKF